MPGTSLGTVTVVAPDIKHMITKKMSMSIMGYWDIPELSDMTRCEISDLDGESACWIVQLL